MPIFIIIYILSLIIFMSFCIALELEEKSTVKVGAFLIFLAIALIPAVNSLGAITIALFYLKEGKILDKFFNIILIDKRTEKRK